MLMKLYMLNPVFADGLFSTLDKGSKNLKNQWDVVAAFGGAIGIIVGIYYLVRGLFGTQQKSKHFIAAAVAFIIGAILLMTGGVNLIQSSFSDTWTEVFGMISFF